MSDNDNKVAAEQKSRLEVEITPPVAAPRSAGNVGDTPSAAAEEEDATLGQALRTIYRQTVEEAIPDEMLDLLKRLG